MPRIGNTARILLVERDQDADDPLEGALKRAGFATVAVSTATEALACSRQARFDLVVLDLGQPGEDGHAVCEALHRDSGIPVVMLADSIAAADRDSWLDGAEDYVVKPARACELIARIRAVLHRTQAAARVGVVRVGPLSVDIEAQSAAFDDYTVPLSPKEAQLLACLARDAGEVITREQPMEDVWGAGWFGSTKTLDVHIGWLRRKLGDDPAAPCCIHTVRGVGFRLASAQELERELELEVDLDEERTAAHGSRRRWEITDARGAVARTRRTASCR